MEVTPSKYTNCFGWTKTPAEVNDQFLNPYCKKKNETYLYFRSDT